MSRLVPTQEPGRLWSFFALFGMQTVGAAIMYWNVVPLYKQAIADSKSLQIELDTSIWPLVAIALIQSGYWISRRIVDVATREGSLALAQRNRLNHLEITDLEITGGK
jgi:hypothetical protein